MAHAYFMSHISFVVFSLLSPINNIDASHSKEASNEVLHVEGLAQAEA